jgi:outer membrane protein TolC
MTSEDGSSEKLKLQFGTPHNYMVGLTLYQPLYAAGQVGAAIKIAGYGNKYVDAAIIQARHDVATGADRAYLNAVAASEAELVYREAEGLADSNLAVVRKLYEQGQASEYDYLRAQVRSANTRPDRIAAANKSRLALDYLRHALALEPGAPIELAESIKEIAVPELILDNLVAEALQNRPELVQGEQMIKINDRMITIASSGYRPDLGVSSTVQWDSFKDEFEKSSFSSDSWNRSWNVALVLNWPLFTGFETDGKIRQARRLEVQDAKGRVEEARKRVEALGETVSQAERGVEIAQVRFKNGIGIQLELLDAQVALTTAKVNRITALHNLAVAVSDLRRALGREWASQW